jgi:uncharacterized protein YggE
MNEAKLWFWVLLDALIASLVIALLGIALPVAVKYSTSIPPARTVTVTAQGKTTAAPDLAEVTFSVVSQGANPSDLSTSNNDKMNAVLQFVSSQNIASSDVATTGYDLEPSYQYDKDTQRNFITGYTLTQTVTLKIRDLTQVATILGGLAPLGVNQIGGVDFTFADQNTYLAAARADAMNQARAKAEALASESGAWLGQVVSVSENGNIPFPVPYYANTASAGGIGAMAVPSTPNIQPGTQDITDNVTITYALR